MFLTVGDKLSVIKNAKYHQLGKDGTEKQIHDEDPESGMDRKLFKIRDILHTVFIGAAFFAFAWITISMSEYRGTSLADIEEQIANATSSTINDTETILAQVEERSAILKKHHQLIANHFINVVSETLTARTNVSVQNINRMVHETMRQINEEMDTFRAGVGDGFDGFVTLAIEKLEKIETSVAAVKNDDDAAAAAAAAAAITKLTAQATAELNTLLQDTETMYLFYTRYLTNVLDNKLLNTTDRMGLLLRSQRRFIASQPIDRINLCYNVCTQNTKTSRLLKSILNVMNAVGGTIDVINSLKPVYQPETEQNARRSIAESKSALTEAMRTSQQALDRILGDDLCYLGSAVRKLAQEYHGPFKRTLLQNMTSAAESLYTRWNNATFNFEVIGGEQRRRMAEDVDKSVERLMARIRAKSGQNGENTELENLARLRSTLMERFDNVTATVRTVFANGRQNTAESLHNYLRFHIDRRLASIPTLSIQNFLPDDLCPLAMNYQAYIAFTLNTALGRHVPDVVDELFTSDRISGDEPVNQETSRDDNDDDDESALSNADDGIIRVMVVSLADEPPQNNVSDESAGDKRAADSSQPVLPAALRSLLLNILSGLGTVESAAEPRRDADENHTAD